MDEPQVRNVSAREGYDRWAPSYDGTSNPVVAMDARHTVQRLAPRDGERILDAGCGTGRNLVPITAAGSRAVGIDFSLGMLSVARRALPASTPHRSARTVTIGTSPDGLGRPLSGGLRCRAPNGASTLGTQPESESVDPQTGVLE